MLFFKTFVKAWESKWLSQEMKAGSGGRVK